MANKSFTSLKQLENYIQTQAAKVIDTTVSQVVKESLQTSVSSEIYSWGEPSSYIRRNLKDGSLGDPNAMKHDTQTTGSEIVLEVWDEAKPKAPWGLDLTEAIVGGYGDKSQVWNQPRDFIQEARNILREDGSHIEALKDGLEAIFGVGNVIRS